MTSRARRRALTPASRPDNQVPAGRHGGRDRSAKRAAPARRAAGALTDIPLYLPLVTLYRPLIALIDRGGAELVLQDIGAVRES